MAQFRENIKNYVAFLLNKNKKSRKREMAASGFHNNEIGL